MIPYPIVAKLALGYAVTNRNRDFSEFLNNWIALKKITPHYEQLYDYWILGKGAEKKEPRWSVIRDVLHLVDLNLS